MSKDPTEVIRKAVLRMLPRNKLRDVSVTTGNKLNLLDQKFFYLVSVYLFGLFDQFPCSLSHTPAPQKRRRFTVLVILTAKWL